MSDFVLLFRTNAADRERAMGTPERAQQAMQRWLIWIRDLEAKGLLASPGQPLDTGGKVLRGPKMVVTDGPFAETKDIVLGFIVVRARDLAHAAELAEGCPMLAGEGSVEVRPVAQGLGARA